MKLMTLAGAYAGQIQDYPFPAAQAALRTGMAARIQEAPALEAPPTPPVRIAEETLKRWPVHRSKRRE